MKLINSFLIKIRNKENQHVRTKWSPCKWFGHMNMPNNFSIFWICSWEYPQIQYTLTSPSSLLSFLIYIPKNKRHFSMITLHFPEVLNQRIQCKTIITWEKKALLYESKTLLLLLLALKPSNIVLKPIWTFLPWKSSTDSGSFSWGLYFLYRQEGPRRLRLLLRGIETATFDSILQRLHAALTTHLTRTTTRP